MPKSLCLFFVLMVIATIGTVNAAASPEVCFAKTCVAVEVVTQAPQMQKGLQGHAPLGKDAGMLFSFPAAAKHLFWMKDMSYSLDIIWIGADNKVIQILSDLPPCTESLCDTYSPEQGSKYVLEVAAGYAKAHNLQPGDTVNFKDI